MFEKLWQSVINWFYTKLNPTVQFVDITSGVTPPMLPVKATLGAAGYDVFAYFDQKDSIVIPPGSQVVIDTGWNIVIPKGYVVKVASRSGLAFKHSVYAYTGTIDSDFSLPGKGFELRVLLKNHSKKPYTVYYGDRVAQLLIMKLPKVKIKKTFKHPNRFVIKQDRKGGSNCL